jgi:hypothetical protein
MGFTVQKTFTSSEDIPIVTKALLEGLERNGAINTYKMLPDGSFVFTSKHSKGAAVNHGTVRFESVKGMTKIHFLAEMDIKNMQPVKRVIARVVFPVMLKKYVEKVLTNLEPPAYELG